MEAVFTTATGQVFAAKVKGVPKSGASIFGGYDQAEFRADLSMAERRVLPGSTCILHGEHGPFWGGIPTIRPTQSDPIVCQGWAFGGTYGRAVKPFSVWCSRDLHEKSGTNTGAFQRYVNEYGSVYMGQSPNTTCDAGDKAGYYFWREGMAGDSITFDLGVNHADVRLEVWRSANPGERTTGQGFSASADNQTFDLQGMSGFVVDVYVEVDGSTPARFDKYVYLQHLHLYGVDGVTSLDAGTLVRNIVTTEFPSQFLGSGEERLSHLYPCAQNMGGLDCEGGHAQDKLATIVEHLDYDYGWYGEWISGNRWEVLPHFRQRSTLPTYVLDISEAVENNLRESGIEPLANMTRAHFTNEQGVAQYFDYYNTSQTCPITELGLPARYCEFDAPVDNFADAMVFAQLKAIDVGRDQFSGDVVVDGIRTSVGSEARLQDVRPGHIVRVNGLDRPVDCVTRATELEGEHLLTLTLDNSPGRLDRELVRHGLRSRR